MTATDCRTLVLLSLLAAATALRAQSSLEKPWDVLDAGLRDKNNDDRAAAVRLLGILTGNAKAPQLALEALSDTRPEVREAATDALGRLKTKTATPKLERVVQNDTDASVVLGGARALIAMGDPLGYNVFYAVLTGEKKSGGSLMEEQKKMLKDPKKLAQFGFEQGVGFVPFGGIGLTVIKSLTKDDISPVRAAAARILTDDPDPKSLAGLRAAIDDESWQVRVAAIAAIAQRKDLGRDAEVKPALERHLEDSKQVVRYAAAAALIHMDDLPKAGRAAAKRATKR